MTESQCGIMFRMRDDSAMLARIAAEVGVGPSQVNAVNKLLAEGSTVPFIARYRKEAHGNLDEVQIGKIQDRVKYYTELEERKDAILKSIDEQGKLTDALREQIVGCFVKSRLEDLYQPYKPKRRTRAQVAKEKGYGPLADAIWRGEWPEVEVEGRGRDVTSRSNRRFAHEARP